MSPGRIAGTVTRFLRSWTVFRQGVGRGVGLAVGLGDTEGDLYGEYSGVGVGVEAGVGVGLEPAGLAARKNTAIARSRSAKSQPPSAKASR